MYSGVAQLRILDRDKTGATEWQSGRLVSIVATRADCVSVSLSPISIAHLANTVRANSRSREQTVLSANDRNGRAYFTATWDCCNSQQKLAFFLAFGRKEAGKRLTLSVQLYFWILVLRDRYTASNHKSLCIHHHTQTRSHKENRVSVKLSAWPHHLEPDNFTNVGCAKLCSCSLLHQIFRRRVMGNLMFVSRGAISIEGG